MDIDPRIFEDFRKWINQPPPPPALRDQFAMAALTGLLFEEFAPWRADKSMLAKQCYSIADAMLEARDGGGKVVIPDELLPQRKDGDE